MGSHDITVYSHFLPDPYFNTRTRQVEMLIYLLRHGCTDHNEAGLVQGHLDIPLNRRGQTQIRNVAKTCEVAFTRIYTSDLSRAVESAEIVAEHQSCQAEIVVDEALRDRHYGSLQGQKWIDGRDHPNDAESQESLTARLQDWLSTLISDHTPQSSPASTPPANPIQSGEESILVVTHEECIMTLLNILVVSSSVRMSVAEHVDLGRRVGNGSVGIVRVWWDGDMEVRARLEAWAVENLAPVKEL